MRLNTDPAALAQMVSTVTETMCGISFEPVERRGTLPECWRMVLLPITGARRLEVALYSDQKSCRSLGSSLLSIPGEQLDLSMIDDSLRELLNMAAGQIKAAIAPDHMLGLPKVVREDELKAEQRTAMHDGVLLRAVGAVQLFLWIHEAATA